MTSPTQRFFMVKVTGCYTCPYANQQISTCHAFADITDAEKAYSTNRFQLTDSCPMAQSQEVEK